MMAPGRRKAVRILALKKQESSSGNALVGPPKTIRRQKISLTSFCSLLGTIRKPLKSWSRAGRNGGQFSGIPHIGANRRGQQKKIAAKSPETNLRKVLDRLRSTRSRASC